MDPYEGTLVVTIRLPIALNATDREAAETQMLARVAEARSAGEVVSAVVENLVGIVATADPSQPIPVRRVSTETEETCEDALRRLRRPLGSPVWHCFDARSGRHVGSGEDAEELWLSASGHDVASFRTRLPEPWRDPAWHAATDHTRERGSEGPGPFARRNEFLRGVRYALDLRGTPPSYQNLWTDAYYGFRWALARMEELDTPEHQRLVQLEVAGEIPIALMRNPNTGTVYAFGGSDSVPGSIEHTFWRCLWQATHRLGGAAHRWSLRATVNTPDEPLLGAIAGEFGPATYGCTGSHGTWETMPGPAAGSDPEFRQGILHAGRRDRTEWRHTLRGSDLLVHVRALLSIPDAAGHVPPVQLWEEALDDLIRLAPRPGATRPRPGNAAHPAPEQSPEPALSLFG